MKLANFRSLERTLATLANYSEVAAAALNLQRYYFPKSVMAVAARKMGEIDLRSYGQLQVTRSGSRRGHHPEVSREISGGV